MKRDFKMSKVQIQKSQEVQNKEDHEMKGDKDEENDPKVERIELKPHMYGNYLKNIGFKLLHKIKDPKQSLSNSLHVYQKQFSQT